MCILKLVRQTLEGEITKLVMVDSECYCEWCNDADTLIGVDTDTLDRVAINVAQWAIYPVVHFHGSEFER